MVWLQTNARFRFGLVKDSAVFKFGLVADSVRVKVWFSYRLSLGLSLVRLQIQLG